VRTRLKVVVAVAVLAALLLVPPLVLGTPVYPLAVVNGNSMFPVLHNGDLVVFRHINTDDIENGTIVVAVEGGAPVNSLNYLVRPIIIHEVYQRIVNQYGKIYYQTKGVNNPYPDPFLVPAQNILGSPIVVVPYAGFIFMFLSSPEGLVALIGFLTIYYVEWDQRLRQTVDTNRARFLIPFVFLNREGKLSGDALIHLSYMADHCDALAHTNLWDNLALWLSSNLKRKGWDYRIVKCPVHGDDAAEYSGGGVATLRLCVYQVEELAGKKNGRGAQANPAASGQPHLES
jgi:signal peptidase I